MNQEKKCTNDQIDQFCEDTKPEKNNKLDVMYLARHESEKIRIDLATSGELYEPVNREALLYMFNDESLEVRELISNVISYNQELLCDYNLLKYALHSKISKELYSNNIIFNFKLSNCHRFLSSKFKADYFQEIYMINKNLDFLIDMVGQDYNNWIKLLEKQTFSLEEKLGLLKIFDDDPDRFYDLRDTDVKQFYKIHAATCKFLGNLVMPAELSNRFAEIMVFRKIKDSKFREDVMPILLKLRYENLKDYQKVCKYRCNKIHKNQYLDYIELTKDKEPKREFIEGLF